MYDIRYEYNNNNIEDIYDEDICYDENINLEEPDGILENTERNPYYHQEEDKESYEYTEEK